AGVRWTQPVTLWSGTSATSASSNAASGLSRITPALLTRMSTPPRRSTTRSTAATHAFESRMSPCSALPLPRAPCGCRCRRGIVTVKEGHVGTLFGEEVVYRPSDAAASAGHDDRLAGDA